MKPTVQQAITLLIYRYAELIDAGDFPRVAKLFAEGCIAAPDGGESHGYDAVLALYRRSARIYPETGTPCTQHNTSNLAIEVDEGGEQATARSNFTVMQALPDFPLQAIITGSYRDEFRRGDGGWVFSRREIHPRLIGDLSRHLLLPLESPGETGKTP
jgi:3-phenylpropionate/cinnamic acid dioxygenase small subunit